MSSWSQYFLKCLCLPCESINIFGQTFNITMIFWNNNKAATLVIIPILVQGLSY